MDGLSSLLEAFGTEPTLGGQREKPIPPVVGVPRGGGSPLGEILDQLGMDPTTGFRPEWRDPSRPAEERLRAFQDAHTRAGTDPGEFGTRVQNELGIPARVAEGQYRLGKAKEAAAGMEEPRALKALEMIPGAGTAAEILMAREYNAASKRIDAGNAEQRDYDFVAQYERLEEIKKKESTAEAIGRAARRAVPFLIETLSGVGVARQVGARLGIGAAKESSRLAQAGTFVGRQVASTPLIPALYGKEPFIRAKETGTDPTAPQNIIPPLTLAAANNIVLGQLQQKLPGGIGDRITAAGRAGVKGVIGTAEQQGVDIVTGLADEALAPAWQFKTRYGVLGDLARGQTDDAIKHGIVQAATFAMFPALHEGRSVRDAVAATPGAVAKLARGLRTGAVDLAQSAREGVGAAREAVVEGGRKAAAAIADEAGYRIAEAERAVRGIEIPEKPLTEEETRSRQLEFGEGATGIMLATRRLIDAAPSREAAGRVLTEVNAELGAAIERAPERLPDVAEEIKRQTNVPEVREYVDRVVEAVAPPEPPPASPEPGLAQSARPRLSVQDRIARMRLRQQAVEPIPVKEPFRPSEESRSAEAVKEAADARFLEPPEEPQAPRPQIDLRAAFDKAGLSRGEKDVLISRLQPGEYPSLRALADTGRFLNPETGKPYSYESLRRLEQRAIAKLSRLAGKDFGGSVHEVRRVAGLTEVAERADAAGVRPEELRHVEGPTGRRLQRLDDLARRAKEAEAEWLEKNPGIKEELERPVQDVEPTPEAIARAEAEMAALRKEIAGEIERLAGDIAAQRGIRPEPARREVVERVREVSEALANRAESQEGKAGPGPAEPAKPTEAPRELTEAEYAAKEAEWRAKQAAESKEAARAKKQAEEQAAKEARAAARRTEKEKRELARAEAKRIREEAKEEAGRLRKLKEMAAADERQGDLMKVIIGYGGINYNDPAFKSIFGSRQHAIELGFPSQALSKNGRPLDLLAKELHTTGDLPSDDMQAFADALVARHKSLAFDSARSAELAYEEYWRKQQEEFDATVQDARSEHTPAEIEEVIRAADEAADGAELAEPIPPGADASFDFGFNDPAADARGREFTDHVAESAAADARAVIDSAIGGERLTAEQIAEQMLREKLNTPDDFSTAMPFQQAPPDPVGPTFRERAVKFATDIVDIFRKLGGASATHTSRHSPAAGDAVARAGSAKQWARELAPFLLDVVMGKAHRLTDRTLVGAVLVEMRLRHMRDWFVGESQRLEQEAQLLQRQGASQDAIDAKEAEAAARLAEAADVGTVIGGKTPDEWATNPLLTEGDYQAALKDPMVQGAIDRYKKHVGPILDDAFKRAQGIPDADPINAPTQIPDLPITLVRKKPGESAYTGVLLQEGPNVLDITAPSRGNLVAQKARRLRAATAATGASKAGYVIDLGRMLEETMADRLPLAAQAEMYRALVDAGLAEWRAPGEESTHEGWVKLPNVTPPANTQAAKAGEINLYIHPDAYGEVRQVLKTDQSPIRLPAAAAATTAAIYSLGEATSHTVNLGSLLVRPGAKVLDVFRFMKDLVYKEPEVMKRVAELARIGSMREHGADTGGGFVSKLNPFTHVGNFLTLMDRAMRLTMDRAYDRMVKRGDIVDTEGGRRDFVNQLGNYNKATQHRLVALLRDTGLGPFATAGSTYLINGLRAVFIRPGLKTTSMGASARVNAEMIGRLALLPMMAAVANYAQWGRVDGDDETPIGAVKLGTRNGKTQYFDLMGLTGLSRGLRSIGVLPVLESQRSGAQRAGANWQTGTGEGLKQMLIAALHPGFGPIVDVGHVALTGQNTMGTHVSTRAGKGESQPWNNAMAAAWELNPLAKAYIEPIVKELSGAKPPKKEKDVYERTMQGLGRLGIKSSDKPPGAPRK